MVGKNTRSGHNKASLGKFSVFGYSKNSPKHVGEVYTPAQTQAAPPAVS